VRGAVSRRCSERADQVVEARAQLRGVPALARLARTPRHPTAVSGPAAIAASCTRQARSSSTAASPPRPPRHRRRPTRAGATGRPARRPAPRPPRACSTCGSAPGAAEPGHVRLAEQHAVVADRAQRNAQRGEAVHRLSVGVHHAADLRPGAQHPGVDGESMCRFAAPASTSPSGRPAAPVGATSSNPSRRLHPHPRPPGRALRHAPRHVGLPATASARCPASTRATGAARSIAAVGSPRSIGRVGSAASIGRGRICWVGSAWVGSAGQRAASVPVPAVQAASARWSALSGLGRRPSSASTAITAAAHSAVRLKVSSTARGPRPAARMRRPAPGRPPRRSGRCRSPSPARWPGSGPGRTRPPR